MISGTGSFRECLLGDLPTILHHVVPLSPNHQPPNYQRSDHCDDDLHIHDDVSSRIAQSEISVTLIAR